MSTIGAARPSREDGVLDDLLAADARADGLLEEVEPPVVVVEEAADGAAHALAHLRDMSRTCLGHVSDM